MEVSIKHGDIIQVLPEGYIPAKLHDFYDTDKKNNWIWKNGMIFCLESIYQNNYYEVYQIRGWNDTIISNDDNTMSITIKGKYLDKITELLIWIEAGKCYVHQDNVYVRGAKIYTDAQKKAIQKNKLKSKIKHSVDF